MGVQETMHFMKHNISQNMAMYYYTMINEKDFDIYPSIIYTTYPSGSWGAGANPR